MENGRSRSRNFLQAGAGAAQKWTGSATLLTANINLFKGIYLRIRIDFQYGFKLWIISPGEFVN
jgi:hypothetical protein